MLALATLLEATEITAIEPSLQYFPDVRKRTLRVVRCVLPDKLDSSYAPGRFTLGDFLCYIGFTEGFLFAENVQGKGTRLHLAGQRVSRDLRDHILV